MRGQRPVEVPRGAARVTGPRTRVQRLRTVRESGPGCNRAIIECDPAELAFKCPVEDRDCMQRRVPPWPAAQACLR